MLTQGLTADRLRNDKIAAGAIGASILAILFDYLLGRVEYALDYRMKKKQESAA